MLTTGVTYTQHTPLTSLPSCDVAVILHLPVLRANISPDSSTVAIASLDDVHDTSLTVALSGVMTAVTLAESPTRSLTVSGSTVIPITGSTTFTIQEPDLLFHPSDLCSRLVIPPSLFPGDGFS